MDREANEKAYEQDFSDDYEEAQKSFLTAAKDANATIVSHRHPVDSGPRGEPLYVDVARLGAHDATRALVVLSGTHGVEGYAGSAIQTSVLRSLASAGLPSDVALVMIHAVNPWGFAWKLRTNSANIDLNRNFSGRPLPMHPHYPLLHNVIEHESFAVGRFDELVGDGALMKLALGTQGFLDAFYAGQSDYPSGLFYGGEALTWEAETLCNVIDTELRDFASVSVVDFHTGLGEYGKPHFLIFHPPSSQAFDAACKTWGDGAFLDKGPVAAYQGLLLDAFSQRLGERLLTSVIVEFGTRTRPVMQRAHLIHHLLMRAGPEKLRTNRALHSTYVNSFYPAEPEWRASVVAEGRSIVGAGLVRSCRT
ncbi:DUF2817 domain-containing protein [Burkholderia multivorans]|nr:DUF2817 domain-containing protein [Burkholderia multivorans]MBU9589647.1 M14 family metallopeptidase [Burkholderia multivorans]